MQFRVARPETPSSSVGVVVFSHGANSNGWLYDRVLGAIAGAGFLVAAPTHVDAEINPDRAQFDSYAVARTRLEDLQIAIDEAPALAAAAGLGRGRLDASDAAIAGHSYGALLALQLVGGFWRTPTGEAISVRDARFRCALAISPPGTLPGFLTEDQFDQIDAPFMLTTGERDILPGFVSDWRTRLVPLDRATGRPGFGVVLPESDHYFGGLIGRLALPGPPQTRSLDVTLALAALFLRGYARNNLAARAELLRVAAAPTAFAPGLRLIVRS